MEATLGLAHFIPEPALTYRAELCPRKPQEAQRSSRHSISMEHVRRRPQNQRFGYLGAMYLAVVLRNVTKHMRGTQKEASNPEIWEARSRLSYRGK
jgi:hypothetical protein